MKKIEKYLEELKEELLKDEAFSCTIYKIRTCRSECKGIRCKDCHVKTLEWLNSEYVEPIKLTKFEYDLLKSVSCSRNCIFDNIYYLRAMQSKGYYKGVDITMTINGILKNCKVIK